MKPSYSETPDATSAGFTRRENPGFPGTMVRHLLGGLTAVLLGFPGTAAEYEFRDLGPGAANDVNTAGVVVGKTGNFGFIVNGTNRTVLDSSIIGFFQPVESTSATAINDAGQVGGTFTAFIPQAQLTVGGGFMYNGTTNTVDGPSTVTGIGTNGDLVGYFEPSAPTLFPSAAYFEKVYPAFSRFNGVNSAGVVVGTAGRQLTNIFGIERPRACLVTNGVIQYLDPRPLPEISISGFDADTDTNRWSDAYAINDSGTVVGAYLTALGGGRRAFRYTGGDLEDLGTLGGTNSVARDLNEAGDIVGESETAEGTTRAFLYRDGQMVDLNTFLPTNSPVELITARAISRQGEIVGQARIAGELHAYVLSPTNVIRAPVLTTTLSGGGVVFGGNFTFSIAATGGGELRYQWLLNGTNVVGATNATLVINGATTAARGSYQVRVSNLGGSVTSPSAVLEVSDPTLAVEIYAGLRILGDVGGTYRIEFQPATANPDQWTVLTNLTLTTSPQRWVDLDSADSNHRLYRAVRVP